MKTLITHFYNEEYLLPWWLNHHKKYFDHGILINYQSTDNSVNIIKSICPTWDIVDSKNDSFDAAAVDNEIMEYEKNIKGWRTVLTVPEFLVGNLNKLLIDDEERVQYIAPIIFFLDFDLNKTFNVNVPLWDQVNRKQVMSWFSNNNCSSCRSIHNFNDVSYPLGRHYPISKINNYELVVLKFSMSIIGKEMLKRRLQIQYRIPEQLRLQGIGGNHFGKDLLELNQEGALLANKMLLENAVDCDSLIQRYLHKL